MRLLAASACLVIGGQGCTKAVPAPGAEAPAVFPERRAGLVSFGTVVPGQDVVRAWQDVHAGFGIAGWRREASDSKTRVARFYHPNQRLRSHVRLIPKVVDGKYYMIDVEMLVEQLADSAGPPLSPLRIGEVMLTVSHRISEQSERP